jgi:hypothetical protein
MLGGLAWAFASVLTGVWCNIRLPGLAALYVFGGDVSFAIILVIAMMSQTDTQAFTAEILSQLKISM